MGNQILLIGLGNAGASIGLALGQADQGLERIGYDRDTNRSRRAQELGAVDRRVSGLLRATGQADWVILAVPALEVRRTLEVVARRLKRGAVVLDTSTLKTAAMAWAQELLPEGRYYVGATPVPALGRIGERDILRYAPRADRYRNGWVALVVPGGSPEQAVAPALRLAELLGARPLFIEAPELDAVRATVHDLPRLLRVALMQVALNAPNHGEIRRLGGVPLSRATRLGAQMTAKSLLALLVLNRENVLVRMDYLQRELETLKRLIQGAPDDPLPLARYLERAFEGRLQWFSQDPQWTAEEPAWTPPAQRQRGLMERLFGGWMPGGRK